MKKIRFSLAFLYFGNVSILKYKKLEIKSIALFPIGKIFYLCLWYVKNSVA